MFLFRVGILCALVSIPGCTFSFARISENACNELNDVSLPAENSTPILKAKGSKKDGTRFAERSSEICHTPKRKPGECINLRDCPPLLKLLEGPRPLPDSSVDYLRRSQCGFEGRYPLVCCPDKPVYETPQVNEPVPPKTSPQPQEVRPLDVRNSPELQLLPEFCGPISENKITMGNETSLFEFPWMALLGYVTREDRDFVQYRCGGSLINSRYVLTAAHCVTHLSRIELVQVRLGEHDQRTEQDCHPTLGCAAPVLDLAIEKIIPHPQYYKEELRNDIALIRLSRAVPFSQSVRPICLPVGDEQWRELEQDKVTVTGWGSTEYGTNSKVLLKVDLPVVPKEKCAAIYSKSVPVTEKQLCAGGSSGRDSCSGDSGGPLQFVGQPVSGGLSYIQYGIVSFGPKDCGTIGRPGVYTRVGYYMDWILKNIHP